MSRRGFRSRRLLLAVLCGTPALWADVCTGLPGAPPNGYFPNPEKDGRAPGIFRLQPKPGVPAFRIAVTTLGIPFNVVGPVHAGDIQVTRCRDGKQLQQFPIMAYQEINFGLSFGTTDVNFDGYLDFSVLTEFSAASEVRAYWVYDPTSQRFVKNELTHTLEDTWKGYSIGFDSKNRRIRAGIMAAVNACAGGEPDVYTVNNNQLILVHRIEITSYANERCTRKVWDLVGGTLRVTSEQRVNRQGDPVPANDVPPPVPPAPALQLVPPTQPPPAPGVLLFEHPLDAAQEGLYSNAPRGGRRTPQVGADLFIIPDGATLTGLRWYGYGCPGASGASQAFEIAFFVDKDGAPGGEAVATAEVQALVYPTADSFGNQVQIFFYTVDSLPPLTIPQGLGTWIVIQGSGNCQFLWNRSSFNDSETALYSVEGPAPARYSKWAPLRPKTHLAFSLYGAE